MKLIAAVAFCLTLLSPFVSRAALQLPKSLTQPDREEALRIVGFGTAAKILSDPYPLGGYAGLEVGFSLESVPAEDLGRLGARLQSPQQDVSLPKFTIGKGLYNDVDVFIHFTPYTRQDELAQYGGMLRWGFYQAAFLPLSLSVLAHMNSNNIGNLLTTNTYGGDFIGGINVENVALFAGGGMVESTGTFSGDIAAAEGAEIKGSIKRETVSGTHTVIGANIHFSNIFLAIQIDRYTLPVFSGKLGVRF